MRVVLCVGCLLIAAACGGGGSSTPVVPPQASEALLEGHAFLVSLRKCTAVPGVLCAADVSAAWGVASFDGAGTVLRRLEVNADGSLSPPGDASSVYEVDPDRETRLLFMGGEVYRGTCAASGDLVLAGTVGVDDPAVVLTGRREGFFDGVGVLEGAWRLCAVTWSDGTDSLGTLFGDVVFDTVGAGNLVAEWNIEGTSVPPSAALAVAALAGDGSLFLHVGGLLDLEGGVVRGGDVALLGGGIVSMQNPALFVLVRAGATATTSSLAGTWGVVGFERQAGMGDFSSSTGRAVADAAGNVSLTLTVDREGTILTPPPSAATWSAGPDGALTLTNGAVLVGGVSPNGDFAVVSGGTADGDDPALLLFVR